MAAIIAKLCDHEKLNFALWFAKFCLHTSQNFARLLPIATRTKGMQMNQQQFDQAERSHEAAWLDSQREAA